MGSSPWIGAELLFDLDAMLPTVTRVVNIGEPLDAARGELIEGQADGKGVAVAMELIEVVVVAGARGLTIWSPAARCRCRPWASVTASPGAISAGLLVSPF